MISVDSGYATGTLSEILSYPFAASLAGLKARPVDVKHCDLTWSGAAWSGTRAGAFLTLAAAVAVVKTNLAIGTIFMVDGAKYSWDGTNLNAVAAIAGDYESGEREVYGTLAEVLVKTPPDGTWAEPTNLGGGRIQYRGGLWYGDLGWTATQAALTAAIGGNEAKLGGGVKASPAGVPRVYRGPGVGWGPEPIVAPISAYALAGLNAVEATARFIHVKDGALCDISLDGGASIAATSAIASGEATAVIAAGGGASVSPAFKLRGVKLWTPARTVTPRASQSFAWPSGLQFKFIASDTQSPPADNAAITSIADQSGNGFGFTGAATWKTAAFNGSTPCARFNGSSQQMASSALDAGLFSPENTVYIVYACPGNPVPLGRILSAERNAYVAAREDNGNFALSTGTSGATHTPSFHVNTYNYAGASFNSGTAINNGTRTLVTVKAPGIARVNGADIPDKRVDAFHHLFGGFKWNLGCMSSGGFGKYAQVDIAALLIFSGVHSQPQIAAIESYLISATGGA